MSTGTMRSHPSCCKARNSRLVLIVEIRITFCILYSVLWIMSNYNYTQSQFISNSVNQWLVANFWFLIVVAWFCLQNLYSRCLFFPKNRKISDILIFLAKMQTNLNFNVKIHNFRLNLVLHCCLSNWKK